MNKNNYFTILLYHGVTEYKSIGIENYSNKHINIKNFRSEMEFIKKKCSNQKSTFEYLCKLMTMSSADFLDELMVLKKSLEMQKKVRVVFELKF